MTLRVFTDFDDLPSDYVALFDAAGRRSLFYGLDWFRLLAATALEDGQSIRLFGLEPEGGGAPRAALVLRAGPDGRSLVSHSNFYSMAYGPIVAEDEADPVAVLAELIAAMRATQPRWVSLKCTPINRDTPPYRQLRAAMAKAGLIVRPFFETGNWYEPIDAGGFDGFRERRPNSLRGTFRRQAKKLETSGTARFELITGHAGLEKAIAGYEAIYSASWKEPEQYPEFVPGLIAMAADRGWLRLGLLYVDDVPAAAQLWLLDGDRAVIYKIAYDEQFKKLSVGTVLTMYLVRHVIEHDKVREIDYGSGDDPYKKTWMSERRERWGLIGYNPATARGLVDGTVARFGAWFRSWRPAG